MKNKINAIDMNKKLNLEQIYNLFKTHSSKVNKQISEKIGNFKYNKDFFKFYSNKDSENLFRIFEYKLSENNNESFSSFKSDIEQYISSIAQIIVSIKLFIKIQDILIINFNEAKNHLSKLKYENELENYSQDDLFLYFESLLKMTGNQKYYSNISTKLSSNDSPLEDDSKNSIFQKFSENKISDFSNDEIEEPIINDSLITPRFKSELDIKSENQEKNNSNLENSIESNSPIRKDSELTLSKYVFVEEPTTPQIQESKLTESPIYKLETKNISFKGRIPKIKDINKTKLKKCITESEPITKIQNKNHYKNLLEMINKIYKKGLINSEEKIKLKKLVIEKSKKIGYLYYNIYKNSTNDTNLLVNEIKRIVKNF